MLKDILRQLGTQHPNHRRRFDAVRRELTKLRRGRGSDELYPVDAAWPLVKRLADLVRSIAGERPLVVVLDTFEEVQHLGPALRQ